MLYVKELLGDRNIAAIPFWANTSSNDIVYKYIIEGNQKLKDEFDLLINGESIEKIIKPELTYREMEDINNIYSFLLFTGYLKIIEYVDINCYRLMIPNKEIKLIYTNIFQEWANKIQENYGQKLINALLDKDEDKANELLNYYGDNRIKMVALNTKEVVPTITTQNTKSRIRGLKILFSARIMEI